MTTTHNLPDKLSAGDTLSVTVKSTDYPATDGWTLNFAMTNASAAKSATGTASGADYALTVDAATTGAWPAGDYQCVLYVTKSTLRYTLATASLKILPNLATGSPVDGRSDNVIIRDSLKAIIKDRASSSDIDLIATRFGERMVQRNNLDAIITLYNQFESKVAREVREQKINAGLPLNNTLKVRF